MTTALPPTPPAVFALDAFLNQQVQRTEATPELAYWLDVKLHAKRLLVVTRPDETGAMAAAILRVLRRPELAAGPTSPARAA